MLYQVLVPGTGTAGLGGSQNFIFCGKTELARGTILFDPLTIFIIFYLPHAAHAQQEGRRQHE